MFGDFINKVDTVLGYTNLNSKVIADNISNFNTPNFKSKEVKFDNILQEKLGLGLLVGNEGHISNWKSEGYNISVTEESSHNKRFDNNNVDQTKEMIKMLENNYKHNLSITALNKEFDLFKNAIGR